MTFDDFERRVAKEPDLELGWQYWNWLLPETTGGALWVLFLLPSLRKKVDVQVMFLQFVSTSQGEITRVLDKFYVDGWRVVSHSMYSYTLSFVLERKQ